MVNFVVWDLRAKNTVVVLTHNIKLNIDYYTVCKFTKQKGNSGLISRCVLVPSVGYS